MSEALRIWSVAAKLFAVVGAIVTVFAAIGWIVGLPVPQLSHVTDVWLNFTNAYYWFCQAEWI